MNNVSKDDLNSQLERLKELCHSINLEVDQALCERNAAVQKFSRLISLHESLATARNAVEKAISLVDENAHHGKFQ